MIIPAMRMKMMTVSQFSNIRMPDTVKRTDRRQKKQQKKRTKLFDFSAFHGWIYWGMRGWGKTVLLERIAEKYHSRGFQVFDLYDSGDMESCFWVVRRCPNPKHAEQVPLRHDQNTCPACGRAPETDYRILFIYPDEVSIKYCNDPRITTMPASAGLETIVRKAQEGRMIITLASGLFDPVDLDYLLTEWIIQWPLLNRDKFRINAVFLVREAASVIFSKRRLRESQKYLKTALETFYQRARHNRTVVMFDTQSDTSIDVEFRRITDRLIIKKQNKSNMNSFMQSLNDRIVKKREKLFDLGKKKSAINKAWPEIPYLFPHEFYVLYPTGELQLRRNKMPNFYHKTEHDYFIDLVGMAFDQPVKEFSPKNAINSIRDVPKRVLLELNAFMAQQEIDDETRANLFQRQPQTVKQWVYDYYDLLDSE